MMTEMRRESPYPMVPIDEAKRIIAEYAQPLLTEEISSLAADGRVLAEDVYAPEDMPDVPKSAMDGYALLAVDGLEERRVVGELTAGGAQAITLTSGTAVRIMTGAPLPPGADAVVVVEQTEERDGVLRIEQEPRSGQYIQQVGNDIARATLVLARGSVLGAAEVGLLATVGRTRISVYRRPIVAVLATGDEVIEPDAPRDVGGIRDSNRYALLAAVREAGCEGISLGIARDDHDVQRAAMLRGLERADVLITSGGVSMGTRDLIKPLLAELGTVHFGRIAFKPGKPTTFATIARAKQADEHAPADEEPNGSRAPARAKQADEHAPADEEPNGSHASPLLAFGLPGFPVSSLVSFEVFVRPALRRMQGDAHPDRPAVHVTLDQPIMPAPDRPEYQRAVVAWRDGRLVAVSTGTQSSSRLLSMRGANALLLVPPGTSEYAAGSELEAILMGPLAPSIS